MARHRGASLVLLAVCSALLAAPAARAALFDLTGPAAPEWTLSNANGSVIVDGVTLPAYVLQILEDRDAIPSPLEKYNERELAWVRDDTWTLSREFTLDAPWPGGELVLAGVDTVADVTLNGKPLGRIANGLRTHRIAVDAADLPAGKTHTLSITIQPAKLEAEKLAASYAYPVPSTAHVKTFAEHKGFIRKAGADFGWDWGPALGPAGVWDSIYLLAPDSPAAGASSDAGAAGTAPSLGSYLQAAHIRQRHDGATVHLTVHAVVARPGAAVAGASGSGAAVNGSAAAANGSDAGADASSARQRLEGAVRFQIPALSVDLTKEIRGSDASRACKAAVEGSGIQCDVLFEVDVPKASVELWWPAGHGAQKLYDATVGWTPAGVPDCAAAPLYNTDAPTSGAGAAPAARVFGCSEAKRQIGFRTVELVTLPPNEAAKELAPWAEPAVGADAEGESMYFRVNGVAMFMKGANLIPFDTIRTKVSQEYMLATLQTALDVNMNVLRVWGGGIYQTDEFYSACDRMGILLWQEAMFACAMYPADDAFLSDVRKEINEAVLRIGHHPSIAVWGGNNENEIAFAWYPETRNNRALYEADYVKLYYGTVGDEITKLDPERPFVDSSPANGPFYTGATADGRYSPALADLLKIKRWGDPQSAKFGDMHFYDYCSDCLAPGGYSMSRFMSEFGWQSDAPFYTIASVTDPADWDTWSDGAQYRQRWQVEGTRMKTDQMGRTFGGLPAHNFTASSPEERASLYADWIYLRQMYQSVCYDNLISMMRRKMRDPAVVSMGSLYWQLNDVWQGASWSSVDFYLRWKPLHYALKRIYAPVQVQAFVSDKDPSQVVVDVAHDEAGPLPSSINIEVRLVPFRPAGKDACIAAAPASAIPPPAAPGASGALVASLTATAGGRPGPVWSAAIEDVLKANPSCTRESCYLAVSAVEVEGSGGAERARRGAGSILGGEAGETQETYLYFAKLNQLDLPQVAVKASGFKQLSPREVEFTVQSVGGAALDAFWDAEPAGHFSANDVVLAPCRPVQVVFTATKDATAAGVEASLKIWTLNGALQGKQVAESTIAKREAQRRKLA